MSDEESKLSDPELETPEVETTSPESDEQESVAVDETEADSEDQASELDSSESDDDSEATGEVPGMAEPEDASAMDWYILKVAFNREDSIADSLRKRIAMEGMQEFFGDVVVPTEDVATFTRDGKRRITKRKLLPGYIMVYMEINDDTWFLVRETGGISDFTGAAGKPMPMDPADIERFIKNPEVNEDDEPAPVKIGIPFKVGDRVRVKEGNFENQEGDVDAVDEEHGRVTVIINIFGRSVPMELDHWQVEPLD